MISSPSSWRVSFDGDDRYMWQCLLYFIGLGLAPHPLPLPLAKPSPGPAAAAAAPDVTPDTGSPSTTTNITGTSAAVRGKGSAAAQQHRPPPSERSADFPGWVRRVRERKPMLQADNVDLLFRLRGGGGGGRGVGTEKDASGEARRQRMRRRRQRSASGLLDGAAAGAMLSRGGGGRKGSSPGVRQEGAGTKAETPGDGAEAAAAVAVKNNAFLEFVAPGKVEVRHEELGGEEAVGEGQVLVQAICSSISSGTELKVCHERMGGVGRRTAGGVNSLILAVWLKGRLLVALSGHRVSLRLPRLFT